MNRYSVRKRLRLGEWDYRQPGPYFVTVCAEGRAPRFDSEETRAQVCEAFRAAAARLGVRLHQVAAAATHAHTLLTLPEDRKVSLGWYVAGAKRLASSRLAVVGPPDGRPLQQHWQRSYYEHVIRDERSFLKIAEYIQNHPFKEAATEWAEWHES